jgi:PAS domain S-box-containing protein
MNTATTILIVEDETVQLKYYSHLLSGRGYEVIQATTGEEGLRLARQTRPDLVLLDVVLPDADGMETCRAIKGEPSLAATSVVLFSSRMTDPVSQVDGLKSGADGYLTKTVDEHEFLTRIDAILRMKTVEKELRRAHGEISQILSSIQAMLVVLDESDTVVRWNRFASKLLGPDANEARGKRLDELPVSWDVAPIMDSIAACRNTRASVLIDDLPFTSASGRERHLKLTIDPMLDSGDDDTGGGTEGCVVLLGEDITRRLRLESQLIQAQKLESIGQLAAGVAHEINTPIQFVSDNVRFLQSSFEDVLGLAELWNGAADLPADELGRRARIFRDKAEEIDLPFVVREVPQAIAQSLSGLSQVANIVRSMKSLTHPGGGSATLLDVNKAIEGAVTVSRNEWKYLADVQLDLAADLPLIQGYPGDLNQALLNIIINAAHAIGERFGQVEDHPGRISISTIPDGDMVEIRIADNGPGIPPGIRTKVFDPFFTTKEVGRGTGQGLVIAHGAVVTRHGGTLAFTTEPGEGTTFVIRLPVRQPDSGQADAGPEA